MLLTELFSETYAALSANKARSGLTILGIVIGIGSVISLISVGQGASGQITSSIEGLGSNLLTVSPGSAQRDRGVASAGRGSAQTLKTEDVAVLQNVSGVAAVSPEYQRRFQIVSPNGNNTNSTVIGAVPDYMIVRNIAVANGNFITDSQVQGMGRVAVLGPTAAADLFGENDPLGATIRINKTNFKVVGVLQAKGSAGFFNPDDMIYVPLTTMQKILAGSESLSSIAISVGNADDMPTVQQLATAALAEKHRVDPVSPDFSIMSQADIIGTMTQVTGALTIFLAAVAGISLLVGGIGIMNMMLTTVTERTREIGLRKAIGAKSRDISQQFLAESVALTFLGGVLGIILGWLLSLIISNFAGLTTSISWQAIVLACGVSAGIGIVFGYYPARRAAGLHPIEALRYE